MNRRIVVRVVLAVVAVITVGAAAFFIAAPGIIEQAQNKIAPAELPAVGAEAQSLHDSLQVVDMHSDTLMWDRNILDRSDRGHVDLPRLEDGNVAVQVFSSVSKSPKGQNVDNNTGDSDNITLLTFAQLQPPHTWFSLLERSLYHAEKLEQAAEDSDGRLVFILTRGDLDRVLADREAGGEVTGAMFSVEGLQNLEGDINNLDRLYDAGMRMAGFAHFFDNEVAGSMHGVDRGGLTDLGREAFVELQRRGVIIDIAHASHDAVAEMLGMATKPVVLSHGGAEATCDVNRNVNDDQIRGVADTGGVIGIGYFETAVCDLTIEAVVDAIDHVVDIAGVQTAALGSDFDGSTTVGWDTSELAAITQELINRGYSADDTSAIMGGNTLRVMRATLPQ